MHFCSSKFLINLILLHLSFFEITLKKHKSFVFGQTANHKLPQL